MAVFVGRRRELAELEAAASSARSGRPRVALVEGPAGIGKSTLLTRFASRLDGATVIRVSGDEAEARLAYGVAGQIVAAARSAGARPSALLASRLESDVDALAVGAELLVLLGDLQSRGTLVVVVVDDLQWVDLPSSRALLFAVRRLLADRVLVVASARAGAGPGEAWHRFLDGDHRALRIPLGGLDDVELGALATEMGAAALTGRALRRLLDQTGGHPLYCRALIAGLGAQGRDNAVGHLRVPPALVDVILLRLRPLSEDARDLVVAAAVLGPRSALGLAAALAGLPDPLAGLEEAARADILREEAYGDAAQIAFVHDLVREAVYADLGPARRHRLHRRAAELLGGEAGLAHRVAAAAGHDEGLAAELERAAAGDRRRGRLARAAAWLAQASTLSAGPDVRERRLFEAMECLLEAGEAAEAAALVPRLEATRAGARRSLLLGELDLITGDGVGAEARFAQAWESHDPAREAAVGAAAAHQLENTYLVMGRIPEAIAWGDRASGSGGAPVGIRHRARAMLGMCLAIAGRGDEGLALFDFLPDASGATPASDTESLVLRGMTRVMVEDLAGSIADLRTAAARLRQGTPLRYASQCLSLLAHAEYLSGTWDDAVVHGELAVAVAHAADRGRDYAFVHGFAALVPAARGDWEVAGAHVEAAERAARGFPVAEAVAVAATARAHLAAARGEHEAVLAATAEIRATGRDEFVGRPGHHGWRTIEATALIGVGELDRAGAALAELETSITEDGPASARVAASRLRGSLALARGDGEAARIAFEEAWIRCQGLGVPLEIALLEIAESGRLRAAGERERAVARLRSAYDRLAALGALPYLELCRRELDACGVADRPEQPPALLGLTPAEVGVAQLVGRGRTNREVASALYVSVKTVEFHLAHIFSKLEIRSRRELQDLIGPRS